MGSSVPDMPAAQRSPLRLLLASPRGFCAGAERAIRIVELSLTKYGAPVYVRHSVRFVEVTLGAGADNALLIRHAADADWSLFADVKTLGLSAGASAPELLIDEVLAASRERFDLTIEETTAKREDVAFNVPHALAF